MSWLEKITREPPRVLLLEDDPAVRRFVQLALEEVPMALVCCTNLAEARKALAAAPVKLLLADLTLPDASGEEVVQWLVGQAADDTCRTAVFSGGVDVALQARLHACGVWRVLHKPGSVGSLVTCVREALASLETAAVSRACEPAADAPGVDPVTEFFGGNAGLFEAYRRTCLVQFAQDLREGDLAARTGDAQALRRVSHNLKSVLAMLGQPEAAQLARLSEDSAAQSSFGAALADWQRLRQELWAYLTQQLGD